MAALYVSNLRMYSYMLTNEPLSWPFFFWPVYVFFDTDSFLFYYFKDPYYIRLIIGIFIIRADIHCSASFMSVANSKVEIGAIIGQLLKARETPSENWAVDTFGWLQTSRDSDSDITRCERISECLRCENPYFWAEIIYRSTGSCQADGGSGTWEFSYLQNITWLPQGSLYDWKIWYKMKLRFRWKFWTINVWIRILTISLSKGVQGFHLNEPGVGVDKWF